MHKPRTLDRSGFFALEEDDAAAGDGDCDFEGENFDLEGLEDEDVACEEPDEDL